MRISVTPVTVQAPRGTPAFVTVEVFNTAPVISAFTVRVLGIDQDWVSADVDQLSLFPDSSGFVAVTLDLPADLPAGSRRFAVEVTDETNGGPPEVVDVEVLIPAERTGRLSVEPTTQTGGRASSFGLVVTNDGNAPIPYRFAATDDEQHLQFEFDPPVVNVAPGERATVNVVASGKRPLLANAKARTFEVIADGPDHPPRAIGVFVQRPRIGRGLISLVGLLAAVSVFALVLTSSLSRVVDSSRADDALLLEVLSADDEAAAIQNPGGIAGRVTQLTSGEGVGGVTVSVFPVEGGDPVASGATGADGAYLFGGLRAGEYQVLFHGAGFAELWFPRALDQADAEEVDVERNATTEGIDVKLGGVPATVSGTVEGSDVADATVELAVPGAALGSEVDAVVDSVTVGDDGAFTLEDVPSPSTYVLRASKPGFTTESRLIDVGAGEEKDGVEIFLRKGDGLITGRVTAADGSPIGGATVTATDGITTIETITLTDGSGVSGGDGGAGSFTLRDLATPATYTVQVSAEDFAASTLSVTLDAAEQRTGVDFRLSENQGSIAGTVRLADGTKAGGVRVVVTNGDVTLETVTLTSTQGRGTYVVTGLPLPSTYTVTFSRADLATQTRSVGLDPFTQRNATGVDASLKAAGAVLFGLVTDDKGTVGGAEVSVTSSDRELVTRTAHEPPEGADFNYKLQSVPPGTYTVSFSRSGSEARSVLVTLSAGEVRRMDATLLPRASISGTVFDAQTSAAVPGAEVRLHLTDKFPDEVLATTITGADGSYRFEDLDAPETYTLTFHFPEGTAAQDSENVTITAGEQRTGVNGEVSTGAAATTTTSSTTVPPP